MHTVKKVIVNMVFDIPVMTFLKFLLLIKITTEGMVCLSQIAKFDKKKC